MPNKPKKWLAALLSLLAPPIGLMYVAQAGWAGIYLMATLIFGVLSEFIFRDIPFATALQILLALICASHSYLLAARYPNDKSRPAYSRWYGLLATVAALGLVAFGVRAFLIEPFRAPSGSMLPTIPLRANLIVQKWGYGHYGAYGLHLFRRPISAPLERGDLIVFEYPPDRSFVYVKRLIGLPGDKIAYQGKRLSINGAPVPIRQADAYFDSRSATYYQTFIESMLGADYPILVNGDSSTYIPRNFTFPFSDKCVYDAGGVICEVPAGNYFTLGDNRDNSEDSRMWGFVPADYVVGKVIRILP